MPVHVDEISSDVIAEGDAGATPQTPAARDLWRQTDALRRVQNRLAEEMERTSSEGFDD